MRKDKIEIGGEKVRDRHDLHTRINTWRSDKEVDFCHVVDCNIISRSRKQAKNRKFVKNQLNKKVRRLNIDDAIVIRKGIDWILD